MAQTVISELNPSMRTKSLGFALVIIVVIIVVVMYCISHREKYSWGELVVTGGVITALLYYGGSLVINKNIVVTTYPENLEIYYLITKKRILVNYADITHVASVIVNGNNDSALPFLVYTRCTMELSTKEEFSFTDTQFTNYSELKESIRQHRFHLD
jgi:hypothetical protein